VTAVTATTRRRPTSTTMNDVLHKSVFINVVFVAIVVSVVVSFA
jgi:hypothetical protein